MSDKDSRTIIATLDEQLCSFRPDFEKNGQHINGYSGGSPEGSIWQFQFRQIWPIPPDRASAAVHVYWAAWPNCDTVRIVRIAEVFCEGQVSNFKEKEESDFLLPAFIKKGVREVIEEEIEKARRILERASNQTLHSDG